METRRKTAIELERDAYVDVMHFVLPTVLGDETATQFRARCQCVLGETLWRAAMLRKLLSGDS